LFCVSSTRRHTRSKRDWSSDVCSSDLLPEIVFSYFSPPFIKKKKTCLNMTGLARLSHKSRQKPFYFHDFRQPSSMCGFLLQFVRSEEASCRERVCSSLVTISVDDNLVT